MTRPDRDVMRAALFDDRFRPVGEARKHSARAHCDRRDHTMVRAVRTPSGAFVAWRTPSDGWEYDWADQVSGYTEGTCPCGRVRRVDEAIGQL